MPYRLHIPPAAKADLLDVYQFGKTHWGTVAASCYMASLKETLWLLTTHAELGRKRPELLPAVRSLTLQSHVIFYRIHKKRIEVIRVLHGRQNHMQHLQNQ
jgi:toxin ParE1/3/4